MSPAYRKVMTCKARRLKFFFEAPKFGNIKERFYARKHVLQTKQRHKVWNFKAKVSSPKTPLLSFILRETIADKRPPLVPGGEKPFTGFLNLAWGNLPKSIIHIHPTGIRWLLTPNHFVSTKSRAKSIPSTFLATAAAFPWFQVQLWVLVSCKASLVPLPSLSCPSLKYIYFFHLLIYTILPSQLTTTFVRLYRYRSEEKGFYMEIKVEDEEFQIPNGQKVPLLQDMAMPRAEEKTLIQKAISQTFQSTAHLANLLPTGTVLAFQILSPIFSNQGDCDPVSRFMTAALVALCGVSCFLACFTDSIRDKDRNVCYGLATFRGLWVIDGSATITPELAAKYQLRFIDFMHAFMSILVFAAITLFDENVVQCFYPTPSDETKELLAALPVGIGVICSMLFVVFPTQRHGIGFPLSAN